jgi:predicted pyridoxine 5'-phosphate oxidase superfamily flavin-nucleotide-binding protein
LAIQNPFHEGERAVQQRAGETSKAAGHSGMIVGAIMAEAIPFIAKQPWAIVGASDREGRLWCSAWMGDPGFAQADPDGRALKLDLRRAPMHTGNPLWNSFSEGVALGLLFIELIQRRRLRVNGRVREATSGRLVLDIREAFPNCPQFIRKRTLEGLQDSSSLASRAANGTVLGDVERAWIAAADTVFLATLHPERGADASHRGGPRGFVEVVDATTLRMPDYPGNGLFNSFGNLEVDARMGMLIPNFETGELLHLSGMGKVLWEAADPEGLTLGSKRVLEFRVQHWMLTPRVALLG